MATDVRDLVLASAADLDREIARVKQMQAGLEKLLRELLVPKTDFDRLPGTDKPTLLLPGAEAINMALGLVWGDPEILSEQIDWNKQPPFIAYMVKVNLIHRATGEVIACGIGACNSLEKKYRWRYEGEGEEKALVENLDTASLQNTILKMAVKRARIDATLRGTGASRIFASDLEDILPQLEPASKKQIGFLEQLGKGLGLDPSGLLAAVAEVVGREVGRLEDLTRQEASEAINKLKETLEAKKAPGKAGKPDQAGAKSNGVKTDSRGVDWTATWKEIEKLGFTREEALEIAGVPSLAAWGPERVAQFLDELRALAAERKKGAPEQGKLL